MSYSVLFLCTSVSVSICLYICVCAIQPALPRCRGAALPRCRVAEMPTCGNLKRSNWFINRCHSADMGCCSAHWIHVPDKQWWMEVGKEMMDDTRRRKKDESKSGQWDDGRQSKGIYTGSRSDDTAGDIRCQFWILRVSSVLVCVRSFVCIFYYVRVLERSYNAKQCDTTRPLDIYRQTLQSVYDINYGCNL